MKNQMEHLLEKLTEMEKKCQQLEQSLQQSEERFHKFFHSSSRLMTIIALKEGRIIDINEAGASFGGYKREELIGRTWTERCLFADPKQRYMLAQKVLDEGKAHNIEISISTKTGEVKSIPLSADPITINDEPCLLAVSVDITARENEADALRKSEEKYRLLFENSLQGVAIMRKGNLVYCNRAFAGISGYSVEELIALSPEKMAAMMHVEDRDLFIQRYGDPRTGRPRLPHQYEGRLIRKDGSERWVEVYAVSIEWGGMPAGQVVQIDITERKLAERALRESEERFRLIAETVDEIFWIYDVNKAAVTYVSPAFERTWGRPREPFYGSWEYIWDPIHPDDRERVAASIQFMKTDEPFDFEHRVFRPDGSILHIWNRGFPVRGKSGQIERYIGVAQDITAWKRAEEALKGSTEYLNQLINRIGDPIFVEDDNHRFVLVNNAMCAFSGLDRSQLLGKTIFETHLPKEEAAYIWEQEKLVFEKGQELIVEEQATDAQGKKHTVITRKTLLTDKAGNQQIVGIVRDITEYKRLEAQFLQAQKMEALGVLAGGVAHDFNNLLNVINGYCELVLDELEPNTRVRKDIEQVRIAGERAAVLTSQLLAFSRKQVQKRRILDLNAVLAKMSSMLRRLIQENIELIFIAQPDLGRINADPAQLEQIVMNLVVNARDAMPNGGKLTIETANKDFDELYVSEHPTAKTGSYVMLAISDNGAGMDAVTQARIFEPFFTTKELGKGTGLGLSTVYGIAKQHDGFIFVYSEPGKGTAFKIYLPRDMGEPANTASEANMEERLHGTETVLVVEDDPSVRALACRILHERGYSVLEASNGKEALDVVQTYASKIHLVLTDVIMPEMSVKDMISQIEMALPGVKTLYVSGYVDSAIVIHRILDSNAAFLQKPFTVEGLARKVREALDS